MGRIYQRYEGGPYYGYWTDIKGKHHRRALSTRDAAVARSRLRQFELVPTERTARPSHSLRQAIANLLDVVERGNAGPTWGAYRQKGENLIDVLGDVDVADLTRDGFLQYVKQRKIEGAADGTVHKELVVARRALAEARDRGLWTGDPRTVVPSIKVRYEPRRRWLTPPQASALLDELEVGRRLWAALATWAGLCLGEIERLRWEHVSLKPEKIGKVRFAGRIHVPGTKRASRQRVVPIPLVLAKMLKQAAKGRNPNDAVVHRWPNVRRDLAAAVVRANAKTKKKLPAMPRVSPNDLRRTFASWLKQRGIDSFTVGKLLGHSSSKMVELVYGQLDDATFARAIAALPRAA